MHNIVLHIFIYNWLHVLYDLRYIYVLFTIIINGSAFKSIQTCKHNYVIYTMQINNNNKLQ